MKTKLGLDYNFLWGEDLSPQKVLRSGTQFTNGDRRRSDRNPEVFKIHGFIDKCAAPVYQIFQTVLCNAEFWRSKYI
jgi:hypothetical protein